MKHAKPWATLKDIMLHKRSETQKVNEVQGQIKLIGGDRNLFKK